MIIVGKLDNTVDLAAVGLGNVILTMCVLSILLGMNTALETMVSQAHGAGHLQLGGEYLNRMRIILTLTFIPITVFLWFAKPILIGLG
jgi:MATE family multidrug resistance protein